MDFASLHRNKRQLAYAEALVRLRPTNESMKELSEFKKEVKQTKRQFLKVAQ